MEKITQQQPIKW